MGRLHNRAAKCKYKQYDRRQKEKFIYGSDDENMAEKIMREYISKICSYLIKCMQKLT